jgi:virulence factor Mce-like protein
LVGLATIVAIVGIVTVSAQLFRGAYTPTVSITVLSQRAGLVMNPQAKVNMRGVQVSRVESIETRSDGEALLHLAMDPEQLQSIPANVAVDIQSTTAFGAKFVQLLPPTDPSSQSLRAGQVLDSRHVTVEFNTVFEQLTSVLSKIEPAKLNETLGALASAFNGRGDQLGQALSNFDSFLAKLQPGLPALNHDLEVAPEVLNAYADVAPDLMKTVDNTTRLSRTLVDQQQQLDTFLVSTIGLADVGNDVVGGNRQALTDLLHLLVPTTDLTNEYHQALNCGLAGLVVQSKAPPSDLPGIIAASGLVFGLERYRYPGDLPKVAAKGGPYCLSLPKVPPGERPPFIVTDVGTNPWKYGNQGILLNSDALKHMLFGPIAGPPRNVAQIGQPG